MSTTSLLASTTWIICGVRLATSCLLHGLQSHKQLLKSRAIFGGLQLTVQPLHMLLTALPASQDDLDVHSAHRAILEPALSTTVAHKCSPMHRRL